jgi:hypothetical protein
MGHEQLGVAIDAPLRYVDMAGEENERPRRNLTSGENVSAGRVGPPFAKPRNAANFRRL